MSHARPIPIYPFHPTPTRRTGVLEPDGQFYLPLALGLVIECARAADPLAARYDFDGPVLFSEEELLDAVSCRGPGVCLFSNYVWQVDSNCEVSRAVKAIEPRCITIHGGPSTPKHAGAASVFLREQPHVDVAVRGEGEIAIVELLGQLADVFDAQPEDRVRALSAVAGLTLATPSGENVRTAERERLEDLGASASPYLTGFFDRLLDARAARGLRSQLAMATLETNRGCPYQCTFCDWGSLTLQKIRTFPIERVRAEVEWMGRRGIAAIFLGDANFGILDRDVQVAQIIADVRQRIGLPHKVAVSYAKNGSDTLSQIFHLWRRSNVSFEPIISIETTDPETLRVIRRSNIKHERYLELSDLFREMGLPSRVQLMMGLPGQTVAAWKNDLQFAFGRQEGVQIFPTRILPNSPMADPEYCAEHGLRIDRAGTIVESATFTEAEWREMGRLACAFLVYQNWSVLKYVLMHLEWDHGLRAVDVIHEHAEAIWAHPEDLPEAAALLRPLLEVLPPDLGTCNVATFGRFHERGWAPLLDEFAAFVERFHGVARDAALDVALSAQGAVLPRRGAPARQVVPLAHDFVAYVRGGREVIFRGERPSTRLASFAPGELTVVDERNRNGPFDRDRLRRLIEGDLEWELPSSLHERVK